MHDLIDIIKTRHSSRTYLPIPIHDPQRKALISLLSGPQKGLFGESLQFCFVEKSDGEYGKMKLDYGIINGHRNYIFARIVNSAAARINYGYLLEKIVLSATGLGLDTCWMGNFDKDYFSDYPLDQGQIVPAILIIGHAVNAIPLKERLVRLGVKARKRKAWDELFFSGWIENPLTPKAAGTFAEALEMIRLAPSAGNAQPWRIILEEHKVRFHFYKRIVNPSYEFKGLHDVDLGICMAHFEMVAAHMNLAGKWDRIADRESNNSEGTVYMASWIGE